MKNQAVDRNHVLSLYRQLVTTGPAEFPVELEKIAVARVCRAYGLDPLEAEVPGRLDMLASRRPRFKKGRLNLPGAGPSEKTVASDVYWDLSLLYHLPTNFLKLRRPLFDLALQGLLPAHVRLLDVGTGTGTMALCVLDFYRRLAELSPGTGFRIDIYLLDQNPVLLKTARYLIENYRRSYLTGLEVGRLETIHKTVTPRTRFIRSIGFNLITVGHFINQAELPGLKAQRRILTQIANALSEDGSLVLIEAPDPAEATSLQIIKEHLTSATSLNVYAPCAYFQRRVLTGSTRNHSFDTFDWQPPLSIQWLHRQAGTPSPDRLGYTYLVFRRDGRVKYTGIPTGDYLPLSHFPSFVGQRVNLMGTVCSVADRSGSELVRLTLCDGSVCSHNYSVLVLSGQERSELNQGLLTARTGNLVQVQNVPLMKQKCPRYHLPLQHDTRVTVWP